MSLNIKSIIPLRHPRPTPKYDPRYRTHTSPGELDVKHQNKGAQRKPLKPKKKEKDEDKEAS